MNLRSISCLRAFQAERKTGQFGCWNHVDVSGRVRPLIFLAVPCSKNKKTWVTARGARTGICRISLHGVWMKGHFSPCFFDFISGTPESRCFALKTVVSVQPSNHQALPSNKHGKKKTGTCIDLGHESCKLNFADFLGSW